MSSIRGMITLLPLPLACAAMAGCVAKTAFDVVTAPVRVVGKAADLATTSQSESDEKRGRELREREERLGALEREYHSARENCENGKRSACEDALQIDAEMRVFSKRTPTSPGRADRPD